MSARLDGGRRIRAAGVTLVPWKQQERRQAWPLPCPWASSPAVCRGFSPPRASWPRPPSPAASCHSLRWKEERGSALQTWDGEAEAQPSSRAHKFLLPARVPLGRPRPRPDGFTTLGFLGGRFSRRDGLPRPVTVKSKSFGSVVVSPTFWK